MKKSRLSVLALVALVLAMATAYASKPSHAFIQKWYVYNGGTGGPSVNTNYSLAPGMGTDPGCPTSPTTVCAVFTNDDGSGHPNSSDLNAIKTASSTFTTTAANLEYKSH